MTRLSPQGNSYVFSTFLGGDASDDANAVALDAPAFAYVAGQTFSSNFLTVNAMQQNYGGNGDAFITTIAGSTDVSIVKTDSPDPAAVGGTITYTLTVQNLGPDTATNVTVTDDLPVGVTFVSATPSQGTCQTTPPVGTTGTVSCNLGTLNFPGSANVVLQVQPILPGMVTNTASVAANQQDPITGNNTSSQTTTVQAPTATPTRTATPTATPTRTPTATPTPTVPPTSLVCSPRPQVGVAVAPGSSGRLNVTVTANTPPNSLPNTLRQLRFTSATNATIIAGSQTGPGDLTVNLAPGTQQTTFTVDRAMAGQPTHVNLIVADGCGDWSTFVGGGATAF